MVHPTVEPAKNFAMENQPSRSRQEVKLVRKTGMKILFAGDGGNGAGQPDPGEESRGPLTVMIAEASDAMRRDLRALLEGEPDLKVVAEAEDGAAAIRLAQALSP